MIKKFNLRASLIRLWGYTLVVKVIMLALGFAGGFVYFAAYFSLTHGWISGTGYVFHGSSVVSCTMVGSSSIYSEALPSAVTNVVFIVVGAVFMAKKAITEATAIPTTVVDASELTFQSDTETVTAAA
ncbi:MAG: hypothetical protein CMQ84_06690 [Gammaproteobacteria bacterium]|nr:hypothetical protein [Gammaproteobacteria bacterium]OUX77347.1 MAG: hypothetical protein CBC19_07570 [Oceanospirillales bacterium TMED59]